MKISSLPSETFHNLASELGRDSTVGWKKLMMQGFNHIYLLQDVIEIEQRPFPAFTLLNNLVAREESVENLVRALEKIGNLRAISIIKNGCCHQYRSFTTGQNFCPCLAVAMIKSLVLGIKNEIIFVNC